MVTCGIVDTYVTFLSAGRVAGEEGRKMSTKTIRRRAGTLHLVDAENLVGDPFAEPEETHAAIRAFEQVAGLCDDDLVFIAANHHLLKPVVFDIPFTARVRHAKGRDGADRALLDDAPAEWVCRRFRRLVIGSGDHIFADLAEHAIDAGLEVTVIGRRGSISARYRELGCTVFALDDPPRNPPAAPTRVAA
jgi:hypothetical protein